MSAPSIREYRHVNDAKRAAWGEGPWQNEPDKIHWIDEASGLDCLMHRGPHGAWCGYVGVAEGHPYFGVGYSSCSLAQPCGESYCEHGPDSHVQVHGGLTYSDFCQVNPAGEEHAEEGICHVAFDGRPERVWWLGFDCAHSGDLSPAYDSSIGQFLGRHRSVYRDRAYVEAQCRSLASQLAGASHGSEQMGGAL